MISENNEATRKVVEAFNKEAEKQKSLMRLEFSNDDFTSFTSFQVKLQVDNDPYINTSVYKEGSAIIYPNNALHSKIESLALSLVNKKIGWNNTATVGWLK